MTVPVTSFEKRDMNIALSSFLIEKFWQQRCEFRLAVTYEHFQPIIHNTTTVVYNPYRGQIYMCVCMCVYVCVCVCV
jgi:hypothetical protein